MRRMRTQIFLLFTYVIVTSPAYSQGTPALLRCSSGGVDIYARAEPSSPIVARLKCGDRLLLLDGSGAPHVRTQDGKDGFILSHNLGQWWIQPEGTGPATGKAINTSNSPTTTSAPRAIRESRSEPRVSAKQFILVTAVTHDSNLVTSTSTYQTPGTAQTNCGGTATTTGPITNSSLNCNTTYTPPQQHDITISRLDVVDKVKAENGQIYTISCSANWVGSNCGPLIDGDIFEAEVDKTTMWIMARKGGNQGKQIRIKYKILDIR